MIEFFKQPWPWYVAGTVIGLTVLILLISGNKHFGILANFRHTCAACFTSNTGSLNTTGRKKHGICFLWQAF